MSKKIDICAGNLDLNGTPPTFERLIELLDIFKAAGYNAILVQWEGMLPWTVDSRFSVQTAYTPEQVREFHLCAKNKGLEIIPLVQSLGHLENFLKFDEYKHLRELPQQSDCINPLAPGAADFIAALIDDVLNLAGDIKYFHIGGDEVYAFGKNSATREYINKHSKGELFIKHLEPLFEKLHARNIRPLLWHDMMVDWDTASLEKLASKADVCVWGYEASPYDTNRHYKAENIEKFSAAGINLWGTTAYKGADGASADVSDPCKRIKNARSWRQVAEDFNFHGLIATGWSRYSTPRIQCEMIETELDSLIYIGQLIATGNLDANYEQQARTLLKSLGQFERFERCKKIVVQLDIKRTIFWSWLQAYYEQKALDRLQPDREADKVAKSVPDNLKLLLKEAKESIIDFNDAFAGLVPQIWLDEYLQTRFDAMQDASEQEL